MSKVKKNKKCSFSKSLLWYVFGATTFFSRAFAAIALIILAIKAHPLKQEAKLFNSCVQESLDKGKTISKSVHFCNGGN